MRKPVQELMECYQDNLYAAAFNVCRNPEDAEDVVQETFFQYHEYSGAAEPPFRCGVSHLSGMS